MKFVVFLFFMSVYVAQGRRHEEEDDWFSDLFADLKSVQSNVRDNIRKVNEQIQADIRAQQEKSKHLRESIIHGSKTAKPGTHVESSGSYSSSSSSSASGTSKSVVSGIGADGKRYYHENVDKVIGNTLYRIVKIYNADNDKTDVFRYTIDLTNPHAVPVQLESGKKHQYEG